MNCDRCEYRVGVFETRCKVCGEKASRLRITIISTVCLVVGVAVGWAVISGLKI